MKTYYWVSLYILPTLLLLIIRSFDILKSYKMDLKRRKKLGDNYQPYLTFLHVLREISACFVPVLNIALLINEILNYLHKFNRYFDVYVVPKKKK